MNKILSYLAVAVLAGLLVFAGSFINRTPVVPTVTCEGSNCPSFGSLTSPDIASRYLSVNDSTTYYNAVPLKVATTTTASANRSTNTICSILSPVATSTLVFGSTSFTYSTTSASEIGMGIGGTNPYATTTAIGTVNKIAANGKITLIASSTPATGTAVIFSPSTYFVVKMHGGGGTVSPTGTCIANFQVTE